MRKKEVIIGIVLFLIVVFVLLFLALCPEKRRPEIRKPQIFFFVSPQSDLNPASFTVSISAISFSDGITVAITSKYFEKNFDFSYANFSTQITQTEPFFYSITSSENKIYLSLTTSFEVFIKENPIAETFDIKGTIFTKGVFSSASSSVAVFQNKPCTATVYIVEPQERIAYPPFRARIGANVLDDRCGPLNDISTPNCKITFEWDINGDYISDVTNNIPYVLYNFNTFGVFRPRVKVIDDFGNECTSQNEVVLLSALAIRSWTPILSFGRDYSIFAEKISSEAHILASSPISGLKHFKVSQDLSVDLVDWDFSPSLWANIGYFEGETLIAVQRPQKVDILKFDGTPVVSFSLGGDAKFIQFLYYPGLLTYVAVYSHPSLYFCGPDWRNGDLSCVRRIDLDISDEGRAEQGKFFVYDGVYFAYPSSQKLRVLKFDNNLNKVEEKMFPVDGFLDGFPIGISFFVLGGDVYISFSTFTGVNKSGYVVRYNGGEWKIEAGGVNVLDLGCRVVDSLTNFTTANIKSLYPVQCRDGLCLTALLCYNDTGRRECLIDGIYFYAFQDGFKKNTFLSCIDGYNENRPKLLSFPSSLVFSGLKALSNSDFVFFHPNGFGYIKFDFSSIQNSKSFFELVGLNPGKVLVKRFPEDYSIFKKDTDYIFVGGGNGFEVYEFSLPISKPVYHKTFYPPGDVAYSYAFDFLIDKNYLFGILQGRDFDEVTAQPTTRSSVFIYDLKTRMTISKPLQNFGIYSVSLQDLRLDGNTLRAILTGTNIEESKRGKLVYDIVLVEYDTLSANISYKSMSTTVPISVARFFGDSIILLQNSLKKFSYNLSPIKESNINVQSFYVYDGRLLGFSFEGSKMKVYLYNDNLELLREGEVEMVSSLYISGIKISEVANELGIGEPTLDMAFIGFSLGSGVNIGVGAVDLTRFLRTGENPYLVAFTPPQFQFGVNSFDILKTNQKTYILVIDNYGFLVGGTLR